MKITQEGEITVKALTTKEVETELAQAPLWRVEGKEIVRIFQLSDFEDSIRFVNLVAVYAEKMDHHPDILVQYNKVTLRLTTHDAGGLSLKDFDFSREADQLYSRL